MAKGYTKVDGYQTEAQNNYGFGLTLNATGKAPIIAKRIWDTLESAQDYVDDVNDSAIPGLKMSVVGDDGNNGVYWVSSIGTNSVGTEGEEGYVAANPGVLKRLAFSDEITELGDSITSSLETLRGDVDSAAETANTAAETAISAKDLFFELMGRLIPTDLKVSCLEHITISNKEPVYIKAELSPETAMKNIIFISDNRAALVGADGKITPVAEGKSVISIIPTCNTALAKTILVEVGRPLVRLVNSKSSLRLTSGGLFRLT